MASCKDNFNENNIKQKKNTFKQTLITDYFVKNNQKLPEKVYGYNEKTNSWHCLTCGDDMGPQNPRQLCGKWYCRNVGF
jgi:nitrate reductase cytochrome c-type subunit